MIIVERTDILSPHFTGLTARLDEELIARYGQVQEEYHQYDKLEHIIIALIAYEAEQPIACGCLKQHDAATAEIKRMYVAPFHRGKGVSRSILYRLEEEAQRLGYKQLILETGEKQPESIGLYTSTGYLPIPNYEEYMQYTESLCYGKILNR